MVEDAPTTYRPYSHSKPSFCNPHQKRRFHRHDGRRGPSHSMKKRVRRSWNSHSEHPYYQESFLWDPWHPDTAMLQIGSQLYDPSFLQNPWVDSSQNESDSRHPSENES
mmetsp:Transcript_8633/g.12745  ORF Transcript_8633/g.12745 Transcript_8633/m.12745 type:complete len:109 (+) Transcript_8633:14-340(+)